MMALCLRLKLSLQFHKLLRILLGQIDALGGIIIQVVKLPRVFVEGLLAGALPVM